MISFFCWVSPGRKPGSSTQLPHSLHHLVRGQWMQFLVHKQWLESWAADTTVLRREVTNKMMDLVST